jgi:hypothetical protein
MGSEYEQIESLMRYAKRIEEKTMPDFEKYRKTAKLLDECRAKKFPHMERLGLIEQQQPEDEENT